MGFIRFMRTFVKKAGPFPAPPVFHLSFANYVYCPLNSPTEDTPDMYLR